MKIPETLEAIPSPNSRSLTRILENSCKITPESKKYAPNSTWTFLVTLGTPTVLRRKFTRTFQNGQKVLILHQILAPGKVLGQSDCFATGIWKVSPKVSKTAQSRRFLMGPGQTFQTHAPFSTGFARTSKKSSKTLQNCPKCHFLIISWPQSAKKHS